MAGESRSTEGETRLGRGRLVYGGEYSSMEGTSSTEGETVESCQLIYFFSPVKSCRTTNIMLSSETGYIEWETKYKDVREGKKDKYSTSS